MRRLATTTLNVVIVVITIIGGWWLFQNHRQIGDWWFLRSYTPPAKIEALASQATMTQDAKKIFYRSDPEINTNRSDLARNCRIYDDKTIELGCYLSTQKIYLLDIQQPELASEMSVTAAHEMLHAAFDRLSFSERSQLSARLNEVYSKINDQDLKKRVQEYGDLSPDELTNELHSILATEYPNLPPDLEQYYQRYFTNRSTVVAYSTQFNDAFEGLKRQINALDTRIKSRRAQMDTYLARGQVAAYNSQVPIINQDIQSYNALVDQYNRYASSLLGREEAPAAR